MALEKKNLALGFLILHGLLLCMAQAKTLHFNFVLKETNFTKLCSTKSMLTVNGTFPGPVIRAHKGDIVIVNVHNQGDYGVTIHWHGVSQPRNPWYDGPENITQCPIKAGASFTYQVLLSTEEGTLWWHAHSDWSRATVHGPLIIYPALGKTYPFKKPYKEETLVLAEWYTGDVPAIIEEALESGGDPNVSSAFTINGQPGDLYNCSSGSTYRMMVSFGKTYLLRIINSVMNEELFFSIANHKLTVVGSDAAYLKPITTDYIMIVPGQTMDVLVKANQPPSHYYMAASPYYGGAAPFDNTTTTAIFQYIGNYTPPSSPVFPTNTLPFYTNVSAADNFTSLMRSLNSPDHPIDVPQKISTQIYMTVSTNQIICPNASCDGPNGNRLAASLNNISFVIPSNNSILQALYGNTVGVFTKDFPQVPPFYFNFTGTNLSTDLVVPTLGTKVFVIKYNETVEIVFQGTNIGGPENHPMHLHGYSFFLVGTGYGNFNNVTDPKKYNLVDPPEANTIGVPKNGWAAIRFKASNPGVWFMHCHLERHTSWGMNGVLVVKNGGTPASTIRRRPNYMPPCGV